MKIIIETNDFKIKMKRKIIKTKIKGKIGTIKEVLPNDVYTFLIKGDVTIEG